MARDRGPGETLEQIAHDFGVHAVTLSKWLRQAGIEDGIKPGVTKDEARELRDARRRIRRFKQENEVLRRAAAYLAGDPAGKRFYPIVRDLAASGVPAEVSLQVLGLGRSPYYRWLAKQVIDSELSESYLANAIFDGHRDDPEFGYRFLFDEVTDAGQEVSERTVWRICSENGWWSVFGKKKRGKKAKVGAPAHDDLVRRDFTAAGPNQLWLTDLTEHRTNEGQALPVRDQGRVVQPDRGLLDQ